MTKAMLSSTSGPPHPTSHQGQPNAGQGGDNQSVSSERIHKGNKFINMFRSFRLKTKATSSQSTRSKSTVKDDSTASAKQSAHLFSTAGNPESIAIDHVVSTIAVKSAPSDVHPPSPPTRPLLNVFPQNVTAPSMHITLPKLGARIETTPQLALCISLLSKTGDTVSQKDNPFQDMSPDTTAHINWVKAMKQNPIEHERTLWLGACMVGEFAKDAFKDSTEIAEMVHIGPVLDKEHYRGLLSCMIAAFDQSVILNVDLLQGLVQLIQSSPPDFLAPDDLVKILSLLRVRLQGTHQQYSDHPYHLTLAVSRLLDVMADHQVQDLSRVEEHEPLSGVLSCLRESSDPYLMYQACYAFQALQYVPDDETVLQAVLRHSIGVVDGLVKVTAVVKLDLGTVLEGLKKLQEVLESTVAAAGTAYEGACTLMESGRGILDSLKEGYGPGKKRPWYAAVRAANVLAQAGQLLDLNRLICEAPCRRDPLFQWGVCQLLGEIASDGIWDKAVRQQAIELLGELYKNDPQWGQDESVKTWMLKFINQLGTVEDQPFGVTTQALLVELQQEQVPAAGLPYPLKNRLSLPKSSPTLSKVQKIPPLEYDIHRLRVLRLKQSQEAVYIPPMAKSSLKAKDDDLFSLMEKTLDFLASKRQVMLVLGDSGAGKSTFNHHLEHRLWSDYKKGNPIPLFINLPAISQPDQNLVVKLLKFHMFSDDQILEIKLHRQLILICDGYDESQQSVNLHRTNFLNQPGQWDTKMIISCRTQFLGPDYYSRFVPQGERGHYDRTTPHLFQEAVIAPFSKAQIESYIEQYVPLEPRPWNTMEYMNRLTAIPNLLDLVRNPFLLSLALEALPGVTEGEQDLSAINITRVQLYDTFVNHWLNVNKRRLESSSGLSMVDRDKLDELVTEGFTSLGLNYATRLALAIFGRQDGNPVVKYSHFSDKDTWRAEFFGPQPEVRLLRESSPLKRTGNQFRFVHRSMLEYFLSRAIYSPINNTDDDDDIQAIDDSATPPSFSSAASLLDADGPLFQRSLLTEPSIIQFLCDRVKSNPDFEQQLRAVIHQSKIDARTAIAAANAITILVRAGVHFNGADLQGVKISGADLSQGQFDSAQFQHADLTGANLSGSWLRQANLSNAQMKDVRFGELPYLEMDCKVNCCAYSTDGIVLAAGLGDDGLDVYSTATWRRVLRIRDTGACSSVVFSLDSQQILFGGSDRMVRLWNCCSGEEVLLMEGHTGYIRTVAFSPCELLASAGDDRSVRVWDSQTGECRLVLEGHTWPIASVKFSADGRQLVSGSRDGTIRIWDPETGKLGLVLESLFDSVKCLACSYDGRWIVSGHECRGLQLWDAVSGESGPVLHGHASTVTGVAFSPDDKWIVSSSYDDTIRLWDSSAGVCVSILTGHKKVVRDVAFSPDGIHLASGGDDRRVRLWDISSIGWSVDDLQEHHVGHFGKAMYSSKDLFLLSDSDRTVRRWDPLAGKPGSFVFTFPRGADMAYMKISPDGNQIAMRAAGGLVQLWDRQTGTVGSTLDGQKDGVRDILYSPCGRWLFTRYSKSALLWDLHDTKQESQVRAEVDEKGLSNAFHAAFSSSGHQIAIICHDDFVRILDLPSRNLETSTNMKKYDPYTLAYSPNGQQLAIGCGDGSLYLWNNPSDDEEFSAKLSGHQSRIFSVAYSTCGQWIASGSRDETVRLWHCLPEEADSWSNVATVSSAFESVYEVSWSPVIPMEFVVHYEGRSFRVWRVSSEGGKVVVRMQWGPSVRILNTEGLIFKNTIGLSPINQKLLVQQGAVGDSLARGGDE